MNLYDRYLLPYILDGLCSLKAVTDQRSELLQHAQGEVLEIGIGTGLNIRHYDSAKVISVQGLDPAAQMHRLALKRIRKSPVKVELMTLSAEAIPAADESFDTVVMTFTLCSIPDPVSAVREMRRVLRTEGRLLFCEHGLAPESGVAGWQRRLTPIWRPVAGGCHMDRDIPGLLREGGFEILDMKARYVDGPKPLAYHYLGSARKA